MVSAYVTARLDAVPVSLMFGDVQHTIVWSRSLRTRPVICSVPIGVQLNGHTYRYMRSKCSALKSTPAEMVGL